MVLKHGIYCHIGNDAETTKLQFTEASCFKKKIIIITKEKLPSLIPPTPPKKVFILLNKRDRGKKGFSEL